MAEDNKPVSMNIFNRIRSSSFGSAMAPSAPLAPVLSAPPTVSPTEPIAIGARTRHLAVPGDGDAQSGSYTSAMPVPTGASVRSGRGSIAQYLEEPDQPQLSSSVPVGSPMNRLFDGLFGRRTSAFGGAANDNAASTPRLSSSVTFSSSSAAAAPAPFANDVPAKVGFGMDSPAAGQTSASVTAATASSPLSSSSFSLAPPPPASSVTASPVVVGNSSSSNSSGVSPVSGVAGAERPSLLANGGARLSDLRRKQSKKDHDMFVVFSAAGMQ